MSKRYTVGIDVGEKSVGCAAIEFDDDGHAIRTLALVSHIHDGGESPSSGQAKVSRRAAAGVARRTRRLHKRRTMRIRELERLLRDNGFETSTEGDTYDAWFARDRLSREFVNDEQLRNELIATATLHIARHRGWKNPWHSYDRMAESEFPSEQLRKTLDRAAVWCAASPGTFTTLGQAVAGVVETCGQRATIRPRDGAEHPLMAEQVQASDQLVELKLILEVQRVDAQLADQICRLTFRAQRPHVPKDNVGNDLMPGMTNELRASRSAVEFQEFRIRAFIGNLRVRKSGSKRALNESEYDAIFDLLSGWRDPASPKMADVAEAIGLPPSRLNRDRIDAENVAVPVDRTRLHAETVLPKKHPLRRWWDAADLTAQSEFIAFISDVTDDSAVDEEILWEPIEIINSDPDAPQLIEKLNDKLQSGRTHYSRRSLNLLNSHMRTHRADEYTARTEVFGLDPEWAPPLPTLAEHVDHPALQRVNVIVRRFLLGCVQQWGTPERVVVEHVRSAFFGPTALQEYRNTLTSNQRRNEKKKQELTSAGLGNPSIKDVRRSLSLQRQNSACLYCGTTISLVDSEMDHIVPDSLGGANTRDNLVAVCRDCNQAKGNQSFAEFAATGLRSSVSLDEAVQRVRGWQRVDESSSALQRLKKDVTRRLKMTRTDIDDFDQRSMETTAFAAVEMRRRIAGTLGIPLSQVDVYRGAITREARRAGGIDKDLRIRGEEDKSRFDRRHHAIDAAVITTLQPLTARTLAERASMRESAQWEKEHGSKWKEYRGKTANAEADFEHWRECCAALRDAIREQLDADRIAVVRPLRLTPRSGRAHLDTVRPLVYKPVTDGWTLPEIDRIVDVDAYAHMTELGGAKSRLPADALRHVESRGVTSDGELALFPGGGAQVVVRDGAADLGEIHHARVFAWRTKDGFGFGWIRVFAGEIRPYGIDKGDVFTNPLPRHSASMRVANATLRRKVESGEAVQIGWLATDDEIEIDPQFHIANGGRIGNFLTELPERNWTITGFIDDTTASIAPSRLALEGLPDKYLPTPEDARSAPEKAVFQVLSDNRVRLSLNTLLQDRNLLIVRRTIHGRPRWGAGPLPTSWSPMARARQAFQT